MVLKSANLKKNSWSREIVEKGKKIKIVVERTKCIVLCEHALQIFMLWWKSNNLKCNH